MRLLACGGRKWTDKLTIAIVLDGFLIRYPDLVLIEGEADGADHLSGLWAEHNGLTVTNERLLKFPAHWHHHYGHDSSCEPWCVRGDCESGCKRMVGKAAGPIRNKEQMIQGKAERVVAFHDNLLNSKGTLNMCNTAQKAGLPVMVVGQFWRDTAHLF